MAPILLIDGRNCAYRAIYANQAPHNNTRYHSLVVMLRFMRAWLDKHQPSSVHVFWDAPRHTVWRRRLLDTYKERRQASGLRDIKVELEQTQNAAQVVFKHMNIRQYQRAAMEADDLIYAMSRVLYPQDIIIVSSDRDYLQIPYYMGNAKLYEPKDNKFLDTPNVNPVHQKALMGDKSDCVDGYYLIGPVKSAVLAESVDKIEEFIGQNDRTKFYRNLMLIDLSLCPYLLPNQAYVSRILTSQLNYNKETILTIARDLKIDGLFQEYERIVLPFKRLNKIPETTKL